jgi:hypothetical protein
MCEVPGYRRCRIGPKNSVDRKVTSAAGRFAGQHRCGSPQRARIYRCAASDMRPGPGRTLPVLVRPPRSARSGSPAVTVRAWPRKQPASHRMRITRVATIRRMRAGREKRGGNAIRAPAPTGSFRDAVVGRSCAGMAVVDDQALQAAFAAIEFDDDDPDIVLADSPTSVVS